LHAGQLGIIEHVNIMQAQPAIKRSRLKELLALLLFGVVGGMFAMPCLCIEGAIAGRYKTILFLLVFSRLAWCIYRRTFRFRDYFVYFAVVIGFGIWADLHVH
jgi:hypothetical protein